MRICQALLLLCAGCAGSTAVDPKPQLFTASSRASVLTSVWPTANLVRDQQFVWDDDDPVAWFNLYYSCDPTNYNHVVKGITNKFCTLSNLTPGTTYYLAATAVDTMGEESDFSTQYVFVMPTTLEFGFAFDRSVTNVSVQSSTDLMTWQPSNARPRTNGLWRVDVDPAFPVEFYRGIGQVAPAL